MKYTLIGAAVGAALALAGGSAHAGCVDPRGPTAASGFHQIAPLLRHSAAGSQSGRESAAELIVGTWHVTYTGGLAGEAFIQWHSDGTEWENINYPILGGTICMGSWKAVDGKHVTRSHVGWLYSNGTLAGYFTETETNLVARDGSSYSGTNDAKFYDLEGNLIAEAAGTSFATRIAPP